MKLSEIKAMGGSKVLVKLLDTEVHDGIITSHGFGTNYDPRINLTHELIGCHKAVVAKVGFDTTIPIAEGDTVYVRNRAGIEQRFGGELYVMYEEREIVALSHEKHTLAECVRTNLNLKSVELAPKQQPKRQYFDMGAVR